MCFYAAALDPSGVAGVGVGLIGLVFAMRAEVQLHRNRKQLQMVQKELSTKELSGGFPKNLISITELVRLTKADEFMVMADICGYALFSEPANSAAYIEELIRATERGVQVRILVYSHDAAQRSMRRQIPEHKYYDVVKASKAFKHYTAYYRLSEEMEYEDFIKSTLDRERRIRKSLSDAGIRCRPLPQMLPAFVWLSTSPAAAIFALRNDEGTLAGLSFRTEAPGLLSEFKAVFDREWLSSEEVGISAGW
jgi:hypothetical protein